MHFSFATTWKQSNLTYYLGMVVSLEAFTLPSIVSPQPLIEFNVDDVIYLLELHISIIENNSQERFLMFSERPLHSAPLASVRSCLKSMYHRKRVIFNFPTTTTTDKSSATTAREQMIEIT